MSAFGIQIRPNSMEADTGITGNTCNIEFWPCTAFILSIASLQIVLNFERIVLDFKKSLLGLSCVIVQIAASSLIADLILSSVTVALNDSFNAGIPEKNSGCLN